jgi:hypothetical protein
MYLMRIGPTGSERPVVRIDDIHYVDGLRCGQRF